MHNEEVHNEAPENEAPENEAPDKEVANSETASGGAAATEATEEHGIVGIRFEPCGKVYCFKSNGMGLKLGERVVVESDLGVSIGRIVVEDYAERDTQKELKPILRRVTEEDLQKERDNIELKKEAFDFCNERIMARGLAMKLLGTDVTLDRRRISFFFSAETRIDFRELVKDLAAKFRTRIELRQVGVRDAARIAGGIGICGRELCCRRFLTSFEPISIKMAKQQELALNTSKLSGICGRLMCCLGYEYDETVRREKVKVKEKVTEEETSGDEAALAEIPVPEEAATIIVTEEPPPGESAPREEKPRRRRRRPRGRRKPRPESQKAEQAQQQVPAPKQRQDAEKPAEKQAEKAEQRQGEKPSKKPFKRKRRRRIRGKKKE